MRLSLSIMVLHGCELSCCRWHGKSTVCGGTRSKGRFVRIARVLVSVGNMICIAVNMDIGRGRLKPSVEWRSGVVLEVGFIDVLRGCWRSVCFN